MLLFLDVLDHANEVTALLAKSLVCTRQVHGKVLVFEAILEAGAIFEYLNQSFIRQLNVEGTTKRLVSDPVYLYSFLLLLRFFIVCHIILNA